MKALVFSDSHGAYKDMISAIEANPDTRLIIFAGDMQRDIDYVCEAYPNMPCAVVLGNNDFFTVNIPFDRLFEFSGKRIFLTHGHNYTVKLSPRRLLAKAKKCGADICIFGHTHSRLIEKHDDIYLINPGPASRYYAILEINGDDIKITPKDV